MYSKKAIIIGSIIVVTIAIMAILINQNSNSNLISGTLKNLSSSSGVTTSNKSKVASTVSFLNGTYNTIGSYESPAGKESIGVEITLEGGIIKSINVTSKATDFDSKRYQAQFISGISNIVVGKKITESYLSGRVNGSSLTLEGFNNALDDIIDQAVDA